MIYTKVVMQIEDTDIRDALAKGFGNIIPLPDKADLSTFDGRAFASFVWGANKDLDLDSVKTYKDFIEFTVQGSFPLKIYRKIKPHVISGRAVTMNDAGDVYENYDLQRGVVIIPNTGHKFDI